MKKTISLITGASGEIGQNLIARFEKIKTFSIFRRNCSPLRTPVFFVRIFRLC